MDAKANKLVEKRVTNTANACKIVHLIYAIRLVAKTMEQSLPWILLLKVEKMQKGWEQLLL